MKSFGSEWADRLSAYIALKRALGFQFERQVEYLYAFDEYLVRNPCHGSLTQEQVIVFVTENPERSQDAKFRCYRAVRGFFEYLAIYDPRVPLLDPQAVPSPKGRPARHIVTDDELECLLHEARQISLCNPIQGVTLHAIIGLAASTGLRIGETVRLDRSDVDLDTGVLLVRQTKFKKDRYVPTHPTTLDVLRNYAAARDSTYSLRHDMHRDHAFFITRRKLRFRRNTLQKLFARAARRAGLRGPTGSGMSFHFLRHRFAVKRLVAWYEAGVNVQAMLPALATYMGHVSYSSTAYYLTATAELLGWAVDRLEQALEGFEARR
jgi:integrase